MPRLSTCKLCGKKLHKEEKHIYKNKTYCKDCYDILAKESNEYKNLIDSICAYFNIDKPTGLILKQIKDYKENFKYQYKWMQYCLWYVTYIQNKTMEKKYGVAIIKYEYENAMEYYNQQNKIGKGLEDKIKKIKSNENKIFKFKITKKDNRNNLLINLDEVID